MSEGLGGITAVGVKELRGRMRGRRAFVILTVYLLLLGAFAWMTELTLEKQYANILSGTAAFASAQIGQGIFIALMMLETLLVVALAPAFTAGAISQEREKQTLDLLAATPISSLAIVVGKLFSALTYLFILVVASIPLTAVVFVYGGVSPDDAIRGYLVVLTTALGAGAVGLFFSALLKRTAAATILSYFAIGAVTLGSYYLISFWITMTGGGGVFTTGIGPIQGRPPEALAYLNPYYAQSDVMCGVQNGFGEWCTNVALVTDNSLPGGTTTNIDGTAPGAGGGVGVAPDPGVVGDFKPMPVPGPPVARADVEVPAFGVVRDTFWPKSAVSWLVVAVTLTLASVQLVSPTRRLRLPGSFRTTSRSNT
ncbi:MAG TPA: ABC transporter permease subunit [Candidatus Limnocylindrales bacterium]|jgi:ABC-type transport system involved in multi-copper enzyme maturation permease subunit